MSGKTSELRTGVIGVGYLGRFHAQKFAKTSNLVGVFDISQERAQEVADEVGAKPYASIAELLSDVEAVSVVTSTRFHYEVAKQVLQAGRHCLLEKPMTENSPQGRELIEIAKSKDLVFQIGHIERVNRAFQGVRELKPLSAQFIRSTPYNVRGADVDVVYDLMIHDLDLCCEWFGGEPKVLSVNGQKIFSDSHDVVMAEIEFSEGRRVHLMASRCSHILQRSIRAVTESGYVECDLGAGSVSRVDSNGDQTNTQIEPQTFDKQDALYVEVERFVDSVVNQAPIVVTADEGLRNLSLAEKIVDAIPS